MLEKMRSSLSNVIIASLHADVMIIMMILTIIFPILLFIILYMSEDIYKNMSAAHRKSFTR